MGNRVLEVIMEGSRLQKDFVNYVESNILTLTKEEVNLVLPALMEVPKELLPSITDLEFILVSIAEVLTEREDIPVRLDLEPDCEKPGLWVLSLSATGELEGHFTAICSYHVPEKHLAKMTNYLRSIEELSKLILGRTLAKVFR